MKISNLRNNQMVLDNLYKLMNRQVDNRVCGLIYDEVWSKVDNRVLNEMIYSLMDSINEII